MAILLLPASVLAATATTADYGESTKLDLPSSSSAHPAAVGSTGGSLTRTFIGLAVVVAVIYGLTWVLRQMKAAKADRSVGFGLSTEATVPLGSGRSVHLIRAGRELVLVGSAEHGVVPIRTYTEDEARSLGLLGPDGDDDDDTAGARRGPIGDLLDKLRQRTAR